MRYSRARQTECKPAPFALINWGHPLTSGLRICVPFQERGGATVEELVTHVRGTISGTPDWDPAPKYGIGHNTANSDSKAFSWAADARWDFAFPPITIVAFGYMIATAISSVRMVVNGVNGRTRFSMHKTTSHNLGFSLNWGGSTAPASTGFTIASSTPFFCAAAYDGVNIRYFYNGNTSTQSYTDVPGTTGDPFTIGKSQAGATLPLNGITHGAYVWNRALSYSEMHQLYAEPFAFFVPFRRHRSLVGIGAGGGGGTRRPVSIIT